MQNLFLHLDKNQLQLIEDGENLDEDEIKNLSAVCPQEFIGCLRLFLLLLQVVFFLQLYVWSYCK